MRRVDSSAAWNLEVAIPQVRDWVAGIGSFVIGNEGRFTQWPYTATILLQRQERVFASTEGSYLTQTVSVVDPHVGFYYKNHPVVLPIRPAQTGYEYVTETPWQELIQRGMERVEAELQARLPVRVLEIGRYDMILNAEAMAALVGGVFGTAAQADRALGYEANAGGTSYLGPDPLRVLGTPVASPLVTVTADRTTPKAVATVQWDDEGVVPEAFPLVTDGVLVDYETMREQAAWLAPWYAKEGRPVRSHGCAASVDALTLPLQHTPNLTLEPGKEALGFAELVASLDHGLLVEGLELDMDFQVLNGLGTPTRLFEVRRGKLVAQLMGGAGVMVRSPELWKHVKTLGGPASAESLFLNRSTKGEPEQQVSSSVRAVPALITDMALIDVTRRA
jgi:TldD protein